MKKVLSIVLTIALLLSIVPTGLFSIAVNATTTEKAQEFMGGTGTKDDPYLISNRTHLNNVRKYLNAHYKLIDKSYLNIFCTVILRRIYNFEFRMK